MQTPTAAEIETAREVLAWLYEQETTSRRFEPMITELREKLDLERVLLPEQPEQLNTMEEPE